MSDTGWITVQASRDDANAMGTVRLRVVDGALLTAPGGEVQATVVDTSGDSTTVSSTPAALVGVYINTTLSAHTVVLQDNATAKFTIPASAAAGTFFPIQCECATSLVVNPDDASTGSITVMWRPL